MLRQGQGITYLNGYFWNGTTMTTSKEGLGVVIDTAGDVGAVKLASAGETIIGVIANSTLYAKGQAIDLVGTPGQVVDCVAGAAGFAAGDKVKPTAAAGQFVTAGSTDAYCGVALETATSGNMGAVAIVAGGAIAANVTWTRASTTLKPTNAGDIVATGTKASEAAVIEMVANGIETAGTGTNIDLDVTCKGSGEPKFTNGSETATVFARGPLQPTQGTTGTGGSVGRIACVGMTVTGVVIATCAEDPGSALVLSDVVAGTDYFTVYTKNTNTDARAALDSKKVNYYVVRYA